jgi:hypothetical protein
MLGDGVRVRGTIERTAMDDTLCENAPIRAFDQHHRACKLAGVSTAFDEQGENVVLVPSISRIRPIWPCPESRGVLGPPGNSERGAAVS